MHVIQLYLWLGSRFRALEAQPTLGAFGRLRRRLRSERAQTTAEYALVLLAAAAVAFVLIAWAQGTDKLPTFFDSIIDSIMGGV